MVKDYESSGAGEAVDRWDELAKMPKFESKGGSDDEKMMDGEGVSRREENDQDFNRERLAGIEIMNLAPDDNLEQAVEAIYLTDQYICPDFFGDEERAKKFARALFTDEPDTLFSYDRTIVAKDEDGNIAGILVYRDADCKPWDAQVVEDRFRATGVEMPEHFDRANRIYMPKITGEMMPGTAEIEFVGVRDEYRSRGIGKEMIKTLMSDPAYNELHLDVLDSHPWASKSYSELGFQPEGEKFGNYPDGTEGVQHMVMRKEVE